MRTFFFCGALLAASGFAQAQQISYELTGAAAAAAADTSYVDIYGTQGEYAGGYNSLSASFASLLARPDTLTQAVVAPYTSATTRFSYNAAAPAISSSTNATRSISQYGVDNFEVQLNKTDGTSLSVSSSPAARIAVINRATSSSFSVYAPVGSSGSTLDFADATPTTLTLDLAALMRSDSTSTFDLTGVSSLPVRITSPALYQTDNYFAVYGGGTRSSPAPYTSPLPNPLTAQDYDRYLLIEGYFYGQYTFSVARSDFASQTDYESANAWVSNNLDSVSYTFYADYNVTSLQVTSVPEAASSWLMALGLLALGGARRRIAVRPFQG